MFGIESSLLVIPLGILVLVSLAFGAIGYSIGFARGLSRGSALAKGDRQ